MSKWWYYTIYKCPDCGRERETYDAHAPWYDSGVSSSPVIEEFCDECFDERVKAEEEREKHDHGN